MARELHYGTAPMEKELSLRFLAGDVFRANEVQVQGNAVQVFAGHVTSRRSRNESSKIRERGNRDGDKLLCNRCPLKHEA